MAVYEYLNPWLLRGMQDKLSRMQFYLNLQCEYGNKEKGQKFLDDLQKLIDEKTKELQEMEPEPTLAAKEPNDYDEIVKLSKGGNVPAKEIKDLEKRMMGAVIGRFAGCLLGVPVEGWASSKLKEKAEEWGMEFPPTDYWADVENPEIVHYNTDKRTNYKKGNINGVAVDDDIMYTIIGYLVLMKHGYDFTTADVGAFWKDQLSLACTAERAALDNLNAGVPAEKAAEINNPWVQWIGADIRADAFGYAAAGDPHLGAWLGYKDAYLSHRRNGIYGEMYFAAAEAAAFAVDDPMDALRIAINEIPKECLLYKDLEWAFDNLCNVNTYEDAVRLVDERFGEMDHVHTNNNACLTVFGIHLGGRDFTKCIGDTVAMGYDNDCTAATVGSIVGAAVGIDNISTHWYSCFHDEVRGYLKDYKKLKISEIVENLCKMVNDRLSK